MAGSEVAAGHLQAWYNRGFEEARIRMPSPFPGMDPYLEDPAIWEEFHHVFITECMYQLSDRLFPRDTSPRLTSA